MHIHQVNMNIKIINYRTVSIITLLVVVLFQLSWMLYTYNKTFYQMKLEAGLVVRQTMTEWEKEIQSPEKLHDKICMALKAIDIKSQLQLATVTRQQSKTSFPSDVRLSCTRPLQPIKQRNARCPICGLM